MGAAGARLWNTPPVSPPAFVADRIRALPTEVIVLQKNWQTLIKPKQLSVEPGDDPARAATVVAEPLERGFGLTLGNALRRVLLSSLQGAAVTSMQIERVLHEFSSLPGVLEDVTDVVLNVKSIGRRGAGPGEVGAGAIETGHDIELLNPELVICTLDAGVEGADHQLGVEELDVVAGLDRAGADFARPRSAPPDALDVEDDVGDVLQHARKRGELMQHALDLHRGDGGALQ